MALTNLEYWREREEAALESYLKDEDEYAKQINSIYDYLCDRIQKEIDSFYAKYAASEGITMAEAKKAVSKLDIEEYGRKAAKYVADKDFSAKANAEMKLYNATMKINRLELLKSNIGLEMVSSFDELDTYMGGILTDRARAEFKRQAGILGDVVKNIDKAADTIVRGSFKNATFSDRIWMYQDMLKGSLVGLLSQGLIQGRNPKVLAKDLRELFGVQKYQAERLMRTEMARVQVEAQMQSYRDNGFEQYIFIATHDAKTCDTCGKLDGQVFNVDDRHQGENSPPVHPNCRCSTSSYSGRDIVYYEDENGDEKIKLLRYNIPKEKFTEYALNPDKEPDKAKAFESALGYTADNAKDLIYQIYDKVPFYSATEKGDKGYGMTYEIVMDITGANGKTAKVMTAWINDKAEKGIHLISAYIDKE